GFFVGSILLVPLLTSLPSDCTLQVPSALLVTVIFFASSSSAGLPSTWRDTARQTPSYFSRSFLIASSGVGSAATTRPAAATNQTIIRTINGCCLMLTILAFSGLLSRAAAVLSSTRIVFDGLLTHSGHLPSPRRKGARHAGAVSGAQAAREY